MIVLIEFSARLGAAGPPLSGLGPLVFRRRDILGAGRKSSTNEQRLREPAAFHRKTRCEMQLTARQFHYCDASRHLLA
jgi:hypothetical protein